MASMRSAAEDTYKGKLDRMGLRVSTASTGAKGRGDVYPQDDGTQGMAQGSRAAGYETEEANERTLDEKAPKKLRLDRKPFARGGKVKGKGTTVNVIVSPPKDTPPPIPPELAAALTKPPVPPQAPPGGGMPPGAGGPPPGMPMMRARGGRVKDEDSDPNDKDDKPRRKNGGMVHMTAGALSGQGRLDKIDEYGDRAKPGKASKAGRM